MDARDIQFNGFTVRLFAKIRPLMLRWEKANREHNYLFAQQVESQIQDIICHGAYDLMDHIISHAPASISDADDWNIPDFTA